MNISEMALPDAVVDKVLVEIEYALDRSDVKRIFRAALQAMLDNGMAWQDDIWLSQEWSGGASEKLERRITIRLDADERKRVAK